MIHCRVSANSPRGIPPPAASWPQLPALTPGAGVGESGTPQSVDADAGNIGGELEGILGLDTAERNDPILALDSRLIRSDNVLDRRVFGEGVRRGKDIAPGMPNLLYQQFSLEPAIVRRAVRKGALQR